MPHSTTRTALLCAQLATYALLATGLSGCNGAFVGNFVVLALTLGVFFGTLGLGRARPSAPRPSSAETSQTDA